MAKNQAHANVPPEAVWQVISDPYLYGDWVVGAKEVREADSNWPAPGTALQHTSGVGPIEIKDSTSVLEADSPSRIKLEARLGPIGHAEVTIDLEADNGGTNITMFEEFVEGPAEKLDPIVETSLKARNVETLRRLVNLSENKAGR